MALNTNVGVQGLAYLTAGLRSGGRIPPAESLQWLFLVARHRQPPGSRVTSVPFTLWEAHVKLGGGRGILSNYGTARSAAATGSPRFRTRPASATPTPMRSCMPHACRRMRSPESSTMPRSTACSPPCARRSARRWHNLGKPRRPERRKRRGIRVHARRGRPVCADTVRSVFFADRSLECCPTCQTGGKVLADRRLSRLLK